MRRRGDSWRRQGRALGLKRLCPALLLIFRGMLRVSFDLFSRNCHRSHTTAASLSKLLAIHSRINDDSGGSVVPRFGGSSTKQATKVDLQQRQLRIPSQSLPNRKWRRRHLLAVERQLRSGASKSALPQASSKLPPQEATPGAASSSHAFSITQRVWIQTREQGVQRLHQSLQV